MPGEGTIWLIATTFDLAEHVSDAITSGPGGAGPREILGKLQLRDRIQAVVFAYENGLVIRGE